MLTEPKETSEKSDWDLESLLVGSRMSLMPRMLVADAVPRSTHSSSASPNILLVWVISSGMEQADAPLGRRLLGEPVGPRRRRMTGPAGTCRE